MGTAINHVIIQLQNIVFQYSTQNAILNQLSFSMCQGERVGLIGDNGSGKTTLLHLIVGLIKPASGNITIFDRFVQSEEDFYEVRKKIGMLFQHSDDQLFCPTVLEDVAFGPLNLGCSPQEAKEIAYSTLKKLDLAEFENRITHQLSGGEKKILALATLLSMNPQVLLLDEPTTGLDESTRSRLSEILNELHLSYILVSHEYDFLARNTDSIFGLKDGKVNFHGDSAALHSHYHSHPVGQVPHKHTHTEVD